MNHAKVRIFVLWIFSMALCLQSCTNLEIFDKIPKVKPTPDLLLSVIAQSTTCLENQPDFSNFVKDILEKPQFYSGKRVSLIGYFRGWDLLKEAHASSPVTRSDWVIRDQCGAIYVQAKEGFLPTMNPGDKNNIFKIVRLKGIVRVTGNGQPYIEPEGVELIK